MGISCIVGRARRARGWRRGPSASGATERGAVPLPVSTVPGNTEGNNRIGATNSRVIAAYITLPLLDPFLSAHSGPRRGSGETRMQRTYISPTRTATRCMTLTAGWGARPPQRNQRKPVVPCVWRSLPYLTSPSLYRAMHVILLHTTRCPKLAGSLPRRSGYSSPAQTVM